MICAVQTPAEKERFLAALAGRTDPVAVELHARFLAFWGLAGSGWGFFCAGGAERPLALAVRGGTAQMAGGAGGQELALLLQFMGADRLKSADPAPPEGWAEHARFETFYAPPGGVACRELPAGFALDPAPGMMEVTGLLGGNEACSGFASRQAADDFYAESCAMRNRGLAQVWALRRGERLAATAGAYAIAGGGALLAAVETDPAFRRQGCAGALVCALARDLCAKGYTVSLVARPGVEGFYEQLGFVRRGKAYRFCPADAGTQE